MAIRPLHDRILVNRVPFDKKTKGGIIIPDTAKEKPYEGTVMAVGNGKVLDDGQVRKPSVNPGIASFSASTPEQRSSWMERKCPSSAKTTFWPSLSRRGNHVSKSRCVR